MNTVRSQLTLPLVLAIIILLLLLGSGLWLLIYGSSFTQPSVIIPASPSPSAASVVPVVTQTPTAL